MSPEQGGALDPYAFLARLEVFEPGMEMPSLRLTLTPEVLRALASSKYGQLVIDVQRPMEKAQYEGPIRSLHLAVERTWPQSATKTGEVQLNRVLSAHGEPKLDGLVQAHASSDWWALAKARHELRREKEMVAAVLYFQEATSPLQRSYTNMEELVGTIASKSFEAGYEDGCGPGETPASTSTSALYQEGMREGIKFALESMRLAAEAYDAKVLAGFPDDDYSADEVVDDSNLLLAVTEGLAGDVARGNWASVVEGLKKLRKLMGVGP